MGVGSQRQAPAPLPPGEIPGTHCIEGWGPVWICADKEGCTCCHLEQADFHCLTEPSRRFRSAVRAFWQWFCKKAWQIINVCHCGCSGGLISAGTGRSEWRAKIKRFARNNPGTVTRYGTVHILGALPPDQVELKLSQDVSFYKARVINNIYVP